MCPQGREDWRRHFPSLVEWQWWFKKKKKKKEKKRNKPLLSVLAAQQKQGQIHSLKWTFWLILMVNCITGLNFSLCLNPCPLPNDFEVPPPKGTEYVSPHLDFGLSMLLSLAIEWSSRNSVLALSPGLKRPCVMLLALWDFCRHHNRTFPV